MSLHKYLHYFLGFFVLEKLNLKIEEYFASEINENAICVSKTNFGSKITNIGDIQYFSDKEVRIFIYLFYIITQHLLPPPCDRHASCHEISYGKRETKLKKEKKRNKFTSLYPLSCRLCHRQISNPWLHIFVTTHNCGISSRSGVYPPGYASYIPHLQTRHSPLSCTIVLTYLTSRLLFLKQFFTVLIHLFLVLPTEQLPAHSPT